MYVDMMKHQDLWNDIRIVFVRQDRRPLRLRLLLASIVISHCRSGDNIRLGSSGGPQAKVFLFIGIFFIRGRRGPSPLLLLLHFFRRLVLQPQDEHDHEGHQQQRDHHADQDSEHGRKFERDSAL